MRRVTAVFAAAMGAAVVACTSVTDVVPTGQDTYSVASHDQMGLRSGPEHRAKALQRALEYCNVLGKQLETIGATDSGAGGFGTVTSAQVQFRCVTGAAH